MSGSIGIMRLTLLIGVILASTGCATLNGPPSPQDPWERYNRGMFTVNDKLDAAILKPISKGYNAVTPRFVNIGISNFFSNLGDVGVSANNLMQAKPGDAADDLMRVFTNTTLGLLGFFDPASALGLDKHNEDFGQTLGVWGVKTGPYLVLPIFGPSNLRDGPARIADAYMSPYPYITKESVRWGSWSLDKLDQRADLLGAEAAISGVIFDKYTSYRNAYIQRREFLVYDGRPPQTGTDLRHELDLLDQLDAPEPTAPAPP